MVYAGFEAGRMRELKYKSCWAKIIYAGIEAGKKNCLCKGLRIVQGLPEQGNKYNIGHLKVSLEAIFFSEMIRSNKKVFIFRQGNCTINVLSASISVEIIYFKHLQQGSYEKLNGGIFLQECVQPNASQVAIMVALWKIITVFHSSSWNFSSPHTSHILFAKAFKNVRRKLLRKFGFAKLVGKIYIFVV